MVKIFQIRMSIGRGWGPYYWDGFITGVDASPYTSGVGFLTGWGRGCPYYWGGRGGTQR